MHRFVLHQLSAAILLSLVANAQAAEETSTVEKDKQAQDAVLELDATQVDAAGLKGQATTEGTTSYTTGTMSTGTKLPLSIRETPQAVTVITRQRMDDQNMTSINDVVKATPGLFLSQSSGPGRQTYSSRGFDIDNIMYDGLPASYQGWTMGVQPNLAMFDRVEVIRGATGLVTGAGNPSAAINLVRKRPTATPHVTLNGAAGSWDDYRGEVDASSALNDSGTLRGRVVGSYQDANDFRDGVESDHGLFYAIGEADLSENTTATLGLSRQEDRTNFYWGALPIGTDGHHLDLPRSTNPGTDWENKDLRIDTLFGELEHRFDNDWKLQLRGSASKLDGLFRGSYQSRFTGPLLRTVWQSGHDEEQKAVDLFVSGPVEAFGRTHEVVVGTSKRIYDAKAKGYAPYAFTWPLDGDKPNFVPDSGFDSHSVTTQDSVYLTTRLSLAEPLTLILGGRLDWYDYDDRLSDDDYKVTRNPTRYAGLIYRLDDTYSLYTSYTDIFNPQNYKDISGKLLAPVVGKNYEAGIKGEYFNGALNATLAVFRIDQENLASEADNQMGCPVMTCYEANGLVRSQGIELELQGALSENWQVGTGYTYARAHYHDDPAKENQRFSTDTPEHMFKLSTVYRFQGPLEKLRVGGSFYWQSRMYNDVAVGSGTYRLEQGSYAVADLMAGYQINKHLDLQLNANNIFDRMYYSAISSSVLYGSDTYGDPRNYMLTAKWSL
jgi:outer membrane receptor for ferric coprogen and ferric-rhodotorulic acid